MACTGGGPGLRPELVDLGSESALVDILGVKFAGLLGSAVWKAVYLYELGYNLNRVLFDWTVDFFARTDTSKLFEDLEDPIAAQNREDSKTPAPGHQLESGATRSRVLCSKTALHPSKS